MPAAADPAPQRTQAATSNAAASAGSGVPQAGSVAVSGSVAGKPASAAGASTPSASGAAGVGAAATQPGASANPGDVPSASGDQDADGVDDGRDNCKAKPNPEQADQDGDKVGDACDNCASLANADQLDANTDGIGDACMCDMPIVKCEGGMAGPYPCSGVDMLARVPLADMGARSGNAVWGGVDSVSKREMAVVGVDNGTAFVDVSVPNCPVVLGVLPSTTSRNQSRDVKVYGDYALAVAEIQNHGLQIFDMRKLPPRNMAGGATNKLEATAIFTGTSTNKVGIAHTIIVNEATKMVYLGGEPSCNRSMHMLDFSDPLNPKSLGCVKLPNQVHDAECLVYHGPDMTYAGHEICVTYNGNDAFSVIDMQDKSALKVISTTSYKGGVYSHQGSFNEAHTHMVVSDELDEGRNGHPSRTYLFDMTDLDKPVALAPYEAKTMATDHNAYIVGNYAYSANYSAGLRILDVSQIATGKVTEAAFFDSMPNSDSSSLYGAWTAYPYFKSGIVVMQTMESGLFVLMPQRSALTGK